MNWPGDASGFTVSGYQQLERGEPFRGKCRRSRSVPVAFVPNTPDSLQFAMPGINHMFRRGHRITMQIQSMWLPQIDHNPSTFVPNIVRSEAERLSSGRDARVPHTGAGVAVAGVGAAVGCEWEARALR